MISAASEKHSANTRMMIVARATICTLIALNQLAATTTTTVEAQTLDSQQPEAFLGGFTSPSSASLANNLITNGINQVDQRQQQQQQLPSMPGHYEFEVAPKMEPPSVRRPPYQQTSTQVCPGSDPFAGFSPKDTLCGNLNEGRVPLNPLGQNINDQSYPFELIKNKTLQFLARALPVLKLEYETIPKVARYLPGQHLLNPTHLSSPLGHEHFYRLNQHLAGAQLLSPPSVNPFLVMSPPGAGRRRRKRAVAEASYRVEDRLPAESSILFKSAHGRIRDYGNHNQTAAVDSSSSQRVITKDGYRPISPGPQPPAGAKPAPAVGQTAPPKSSVVVVSNNTSHGNKQFSLTSVSASAAAQNKVGGLENRQHQPQPAVGSTPASQPSAPPAGNSQQQQQRDHAKATTADGGQGAPAATTSSTPAPSTTTTSTTPRSPTKQQAAAKDQAGTTSAASSSGSSRDQTSSSGLSKRRSLMGCSDSSNGFSSAICQAAVALIEGGDRQPAWLNVMRHLGNAFAGATDASASSSSNPVWSILSGLNAIYGAGNTEAQSKSAGGQGPQQSNNKLNLINLVASLLSSGSSGSISRSSSSTSPSTRENSSSSSEEPSAHKAIDTTAGSSSFSSSLANSLGGSTMAKLALAGWASNAFAGLLDYFAPSLFSSAARGFSRRKKPYDPMEQFVDTPASLAALTAAASSQQQQSRQNEAPSQQQQQQALKQPPTPCPSVEEYISPTFARNYQGTWKYVIQIPHEGYFTQTIQRTSCVRQRCEFTEGVCHESPRWVSLLVAEIYYPHAVFSQPTSGAATSHQLTPTVANSMLMQQQQQPQPQPQQVPTLSASPSMSSIQQVKPGQGHLRPLRGSSGGSVAASVGGHGQTDPLQMTDSLNTYNHNLNSAFIQEATRQGLDPSNVANMQQLADLYSYQLMQRNGLVPGQQVVESRSSPASLNNPLLGVAASSPHYTIQPPANQPPQQQQQQLQQQLQQQQLQQLKQVLGADANGDQIRRLAEEVLQENPHMSVNDLMASLQQILNRKKRDLTSQGSSNAWAPQSQQQPAHRIQQRSSAATGNGQLVDQASINHQAQNEIPSAGQQQSPFVKPSSLDAPVQQQQQHHQRHSDAQGVASNLAGSLPSEMGADSAAVGANDQTECDGHDKIGCYVVRVYYDWFLVNGSCKCWKTTGNQQQSGQQSGNSFLRRIFTG